MATKRNDYLKVMNAFNVFTTNDMVQDTRTKDPEKRSVEYLCLPICESKGLNDYLDIPTYIRRGLSLSC